MNANSLPGEIAAIVGVIDPDVTAAGAVSSDWVNMADFESIMAIAMAGTLGTSATLDAKIQQATDSSGTGVKDVSGKAITQLVKASNDDNQAVINCRAEDLDLANDFTHARLTITVGTATSDAAGIVLGFNARRMPVDGEDLASVVEIV